jgi:hypothetical protein
LPPARFRSGFPSPGLPSGSRQASLAGSSPCRPPVVLRVIPQSTVDRILDHDRPDGTLSPALDLVLNEEDEDEEQQQEQQAEDGVRSLSTAKRRRQFPPALLLRDSG